MSYFRQWQGGLWNSKNHIRKAHKYKRLADGYPQSFVYIGLVSRQEPWAQSGTIVVYQSISYSSYTVLVVNVQVESAYLRQITLLEEAKVTQTAIRPIESCDINVSSSQVLLVLLRLLVQVS